MPEYLAPGVYVEEVSFRSKSIEGVSTTTTGFVGPTRYGPVAGDLDVITSLLDFERVYGDRQKLAFADPQGGDDPVVIDNYMWHAVRAFFENGGRRLYVKRVFREAATDGHATATVPSANGSGGMSIRVSARFPGAVGERRVRFTLRRGQNVLASTPDGPRLRGLLDRDVVAISRPDVASPPSPPSPPDPPRPEFYLAQRIPTGGWRFHGRHGDSGSPPTPLALTDLRPDAGDQVRLITVTVTDFPDDPDSLPGVWVDLPLDPAHERAGTPDSIFTKFAARPANRADEQRLPIVVASGTGVSSGLDVVDVLFAHSLRGQPNPAVPTGQPERSPLERFLSEDTSTDEQRSVDVRLSAGHDGLRPTAAQYEGSATNLDDKTGLKAFEDIDDISIVAAPGSTFGFEDGYHQDGATIINTLISHCTRMRYRIAVLDSGENQTIPQVRAMRAAIDSTYAAFYYPWVTVLDPVTQQEIQLPPSGFVCGIYARNDIERAVYKAPANEVVALALRFEKLLNKAQQDVLNPEGINCFRYFPGRGYRLWGARTATSDPEWKYVNLRRYFAYLEHSIDRGTQWAVFEPNGERLWANVRRTIEDFLFNEWQMGALLGDKPEKAFFVRCDRSTMTQNDLDNGRLVCLIGVAPLRPAEYVIFRIGQWTADRRT
jgi:phage tail sheath protein FI